MPHVVHQPAKKDASRTINKAIVIIDLQARIRGQSSRGRESEQMSIRPNVADTGGGARVLGYILLTSIPKTSRKVVVKGSDYKSIKRLEELRGQCSLPLHIQLPKIILLPCVLRCNISGVLSGFWIVRLVDINRSWMMIRCEEKNLGSKDR